MVNIRDASERELETALAIEKTAFRRDDEAELVARLMTDPSAKPFLSLLAFIDDRAVGHILFTKASLEGTTQSLSLNILAPLAVLPNAQGQGIGGRLIHEGLRRLARMGVDLVFVLGYPEYYLRHGFKLAGRNGFNAPYPIPEKNADAWMVQALRKNVIGFVSGRVVCADTLNRQEYWRE